MASRRLVSELVYVRGRPKAILRWIDIAGVRTPIYVEPADESRSELKYRSAIRRLSRSDLSDPRERRTIPLVRQSGGAVKDCPLAPPERASVQARTLHRACLIVGGIEQLAERLKVSDVELRRWLKGEDKPPEAVFVAAIEIVLLYAAEAGKAN